MPGFSADLRTRALRQAELISPERYLQSLVDLIRIPSHAGQEAGITAWLYERLLALGFEVTVDAQANVVGRLAGGPRRLLLVAHRNIQEPDPQMSEPLIARLVEREGDVLIYGLGAASCKASLAAMIEALTVISKQPLQRPTLLFASHPGTFSPFGSGIADLFRLHDLSADGAIVGEPTALAVGVGARGYAHIEVHFDRSRPYSDAAPPATHPISAAVAFLRELRAQTLPDHTRLGPATLTPIQWWSAASHEPLIDSAGVLLDRRILPGEPGLDTLVEQYAQHAARQFPSGQVRTVVQRHQYPYEVDRSAPIVAALSEAVKLCRGADCEYTVLPYSCGAGTVQQIGRITPVAFSGNNVGYLGAQEHSRLRPNIIASRALVAAMTLFATPSSTEPMSS